MNTEKRLEYFTTHFHDPIIIINFQQKRDIYKNAELRNEKMIVFRSLFIINT